MCDIGKDEGNPSQEQIPNQAEMPARFTVGHPRNDKPNANNTCDIEQGKDGNVMPVTDEEVAESVEHKLVYRNAREERQGIDSLHALRTWQLEIYISFRK